MAVAKWIGLMVLLFTSHVFAQQSQVTASNIFTSEQVAKVERSHKLKERFDVLLPLFLDSELEALNYNLTTLPVIQREYLFYLFCQYAMDMNYLDDKTQAWLGQLAMERPTALTEKHDADFVVSEPAFDYPAQARAALKSWRDKHQHLDYHRQLSQGQLEVEAIFNSNNPYLNEQQASLARVLPMQTPKRLLWLEDQIQQPSVFFADNLIIATMANLNSSEALYRRLWQRPVDQYSMEAAWWVKNNYPSQQAYELLKIAAKNPELTEHAWQLMAELKPMPASAEAYLVSALASEDMGEVAAQVLAQLNDRNVLTRLVKIVTEGDPANNQTQNAWLSLFLNNSSEARKLIKQLFELDAIRKNYGPVQQQ